jgi:KRAB domain-containing zinc finger protein
MPIDLERYEFLRRFQENVNENDLQYSYPPEFEEFAEDYQQEESEENSENEDCFDYNDFDHISMLEPICELKSEDDDKSALNQEAMQLYKQAMEINYAQNGIKRRGKRKHLSADENSSSSSNGALMQPPIPAAPIKLPQGPGRGRRREIDDAEMEAINSSGDCFFQCTLCDKSYKFAGDLAKHVRSHTLNRPYQCSICEKSFTHIGSLNTHLRQVASNYMLDC